METHPYSGTQYAEAKAPQAIAPNAPAAAIEAQTKGMQAVNANIHGMESDLQDRLEYTLDQQRKLYLAKTQSEIDATFAQAMSYPDGHPQSLWNQDGSFKDAYYKELMHSQLSRLDGLEHGYIRPDSQQAVKNQTAELKSKISTAMHVKVATALAPRAKSATLNLAKWQASQGDYASAIATVQGAPAHAMSELERQQAIIDISQTEVLNNAKMAAVTNDTAAYLGIIGNDKLMRSLTPEQQQQILSMQSRFADDDPPADQINLSPGASTSSSPRVTPKNPLPLGVTDDLVALHTQWLDSNGNYPSEGEAIRQAVSHLDSFASRFVHPNMTENDRQLFYNIASCFNVDKEDAKVIIARYEEPFNMAKNGFDYNKALDAIDNMNREYFSATWAQRQVAQSTAAVGKATAELQALANQPENADPKEAGSTIKEATEKLAAAQAQLKIAETFKQEWIDKRKDQIKKEFADWYLTQDKSKLTDVECRMKLYDIAETVMHSAADNEDEYAQSQWNIAASAEFRLSRQAWESASRARGNATASRAVLDAETTQTDQNRAYAEQEAALTEAHQFPAASTFPVALTNAASLPDSTTTSYIAVPKGSPMAGKTLALRHNRRTRAIPCVESEVAAPTLSMRAQLNLGMLNSPATFSISHDPDGNAVLTSHAVPQSQKNIYDIMLSQEIRRDRSGRPIVYNLPQADGGGSYEVAGLNEKYNKQEAEALKHMINTGVPTPMIESYIRSVYKRKTQFGADYLPAAHSQGLELFLRDCALNHSERGVRTILANAIGTYKDNPNLNTAVSQYISQYGEPALLRKLTQARGLYYESLIDNNPSREIFRKGWSNRNRNIYNAAFSLLNTSAQ